MTKIKSHNLKPINEQDLQGTEASSLKPLVSVICIVYNHGKYLRECLEGILAQETAFNVEIIVHDDASTDNSQEVIREYGEKYPSVFKTILQTTNQLRNIGGRIVLNAFSIASGDYIAYCDGDDRWTDPLKLTYQIGYLEENSDCSGCFHRSRLINSEGELFQEDYFLPLFEKYDTSECIARLASAYSTSSLVFRREALDSPPEWLCKNLTDLFLEFQISRFGKIGFVNRNMSDYRKHSGGIWSSRSMVEQLTELIHRYMTLLEEPEFGERYSQEIKGRIEEYTGMLCLKNNTRVITAPKKKWIKLLKYIGLKNRNNDVFKET